MTGRVPGQHRTGGSEDGPPLGLEVVAEHGDKPVGVVGEGLLDGPEPCRAVEAGDSQHSIGMLRRIEWPRKRKNACEPPPCTQGRTGAPRSGLNEGCLEDLLAPRTLTGLQRDSPVPNDIS